MGKLLLSAFAGLAAGAALGILFAPDKGTKTRKKLLRRKTEFADDMSDNFNEFIESLTQKFEAIKSQANLISTNGKQKEEISSIKK